jgi:hypothetical protein
MTDAFPVLPVFRDLTLNGAGPRLDDLADAIVARLREPWIRDQQVEAEGFGDYRVFRRDPNGDRPGLRLFLSANSTGDVYVSNILPMERGRLTMAEYNEALTEFYETFLQRAAAAGGLEAVLGTDTLDLQTELPDDAISALHTFSRAANRSTGSSHPMDMERWLRFIVCLHKSRKTLSPSVLNDWLQADGWPPDISLELTLEFEFAATVLDYADKY